MAKYLNLIKESTLSVQDTTHGGDPALFEHDYLAVIEDDNGLISIVPCDGICMDCDADSLVDEMPNSDIISNLGPCKRRENLIKEGLTEWCLNDPVAYSAAEAITIVVSLLQKYGIWEREYASYLDVQKILDEYEQ